MIQSCLYVCNFNIFLSPSVINANSNQHNIIKIEINGTVRISCVNLLDFHQSFKSSFHFHPSSNYDPSSNRVTKSKKGFFKVFQRRKNLFTSGTPFVNTFTYGTLFVRLPFLLSTVSTFFFPRPSPPRAAATSAGCMCSDPQIPSVGASLKRQGNDSHLDTRKLLWLRTAEVVGVVGPPRRSIRV